MDFANAEETEMKCTIEGCPGEYEDRQIIHTVRYRGRVIVIDQVPAEVCTVCGDVLLKPETVRRIETMLKTSAKAKKMAPVFDYA